MTRRRILAVSWGLMGDTIMGTPALRALRLGQPDAYLAFSCHAPWAPLFDDRTLVDEVIPVRLKRWKGLLGLFRRPADLARIAAPGWDAVLDLGGGGNVIRLTRRIRPRLAVSIRSDPRAPYDGVVDPAIRHQSDRCLAAAAQMGGIGDDRSYQLARIAADATPWPPGPGSRVLLNPGASELRKRWPPERFAETANALIAQGCTVVVVWGPGERELAERICAASQAVLAPPTSPLGLARVIAAAHLLITGDSGPMHLASGLRVPVVALFSTSDPAVYTPPGRVAVIGHGGPIDGGGMAVAEVVAAAQGLMAS